MKKTLLYMILSLATIAAGAQNTVLTLQQCKDLSVRNDPYLRNARLDILAAQQTREEVRMEYFPTVSVTAAAFHSLHPLIDLGVTDILGKSDNAWNIKNYVDETFPQYDLPTRYKALQYGYGVSLSVMQPVYAGGRIATGNRLALLGVEAARLKAGVQHRNTDTEIEEKYWRIVSLQEKQTTLAVALELLDSLDKDVASAIAAGVATESDRLQVRLKINELRSSKVQLDGGLRLAKMDLFNAIGLEYDDVDRVELIDRIDGAGAPEEYYVPEEQVAAAMEESRLLDLQVKAAELQKKLALGEALPEVAVGGMYGYGHYLGDAGGNGALYAMVKIPVSQWGKTLRQTKKYDYEIEKASNERDYLDAQLVLRARQLWVELTTAWEQMKVASESVEVASDAASHMEASYRAGLSTMTELLQSRTSRRQAEDAYIDACIAYRTALNTYRSTFFCHFKNNPYICTP